MLQYHQQIKRKLGQRYRLDPNMDDREYVDTLTGYNTSLEKNELLSLLKRLKQKDISEPEMVHLAAEASKWIEIKPWRTHEPNGSQEHFSRLAYGSQ